jgi:putative PIN family toxin of toxin-antitoxin system
MRVVVDTNILISALLADRSLPAHLIALWRGGLFDLVTSSDQVEELVRVSRYPKIRERVMPALAGRLINELRHLAVWVVHPVVPAVSPDPDDDYLLALAVAGGAHFLVSGDKRDLLALRRYKGTKIVTVREFLTLGRVLP